MRIYRVSSLVLACAAVLAAQEKMTVPLSSPSQPATVKVNLMMGGITVTGGAAGQVIVELAGPSQPARAEREVPPGMHRIDVGGGGLDAQEDHNVVTISAGRRMGGNLRIQVPANTSLKLKTVAGGPIDVTGVNGDLEVDNINGTITLKNVSGSVVAHSMNGGVTASLDRVAPDKAMAFTSLNGKVDVTLPADTKARVRFKTDNGEVFSDFDVKMEPDTAKPVVDDSRRQGGRYRIRMDHSVYGSINGGGPEYRFETMNGNILIHKK